MQKSVFAEMLFILLMLMVMSCKKEKQAANVTAPVPTVPTPISDDVLKDSALYYSRDIYLWNTQIPASFNAREYSDLNKMMEAMRQYSIEPGFSTAVDRFSFAMKKTEWDAMSAGLNWLATTTDDGGDFGLTVFFKVEGDLRVRLVEPNSPAGLAGIRRGWRVTKINDNASITTSNSTFIINNIYESASVSITFLKPDNSTVTIDLAKAEYVEKPVYLDTVYNINSKKVGYLVFNSFLGKTEDILSEFQRVFNKFGSEGVNEMVVDLRYNGGGYVSVQQKLANYLVNPAADGSIMMNQIYNSNNSGSNETTRYKKEGALNLGRIYFIVGNATASASELLINNLKPYMDVKLVGGTTYGKPVGFFPIPVGEWYIFPVSFRSTNKNGEGNYFDGFPVNSRIADGLDKDWGDLTETSLASAIKNITTGSFRSPSEQPYVEPGAITKANKLLDRPFLKATIGDIKSLK